MKSFAYSTVVALAAAGVLWAALPASGQDTGYPPDEPFPVALRVGEIFHACTSGRLNCPAKSPICDDPNIAAAVDTPDGLGFKALAPGTTLCSAASSNNLRSVFRITVR